MAEDVLPREADAMRRVVERETQVVAGEEQKRLQQQLDIATTRTRWAVQGRAKELLAQAEAEIADAYEQWPDAERIAALKTFLEDELAGAEQRIRKQARKLGLSETVATPRLKPVVRLSEQERKRRQTFQWAHSGWKPPELEYSPGGARSRREELLGEAKARVSEIEQEALAELERVASTAEATLGDLDPRSDEAMALPASIPAVDDLMPATVPVKGLVKRRPKSSSSGGATVDP